MKKSLLLAAGAFLALSLGLAPEAAAQKSVPTRTLAAAGDTVWVIVNSVKPEKRAQFERFVYEIFWPLAPKLNAADQRTFRHTRVLSPLRPEADGTYSYLFIMDPVQRKESYDMLKVLNKVYDKTKSEEYYKLFTESLASNPKQYSTVQSRY